ncbi:hypothetical protein HBI60_032030 [Parastagonospora nodorum]|nr:hypothetical protein HBI60_032030 [Parastagonospora nodorum]
MAPYLDPLNQAFADAFAKQPPIEDLSPPEFRVTFEELQHHDKTISGVTRTGFTVPFESGAEVFVFRKDSMKRVDSLPVVLFLHGGAFIVGSVTSYDSICRDLALQTGYAIVFVEYALAPEARWPTQQEQCYAVLKWITQNGAKKGLSQDKFAVVGDSAGGQLAIATSILASTRTPKIPISHQSLLHPCTDTRISDRQTLSEFEFFAGPLLTVPFNKKSFAIYIPNADDRDSELATPLNISAAHAKLQPPTLIINSAVDLLRSEGEAYGEILQRAGVDCTVLTTHGQVHDSEVFEATRGGPTPRAVVRMVAGEIRHALGGGFGEEGKSGEDEGMGREMKRRKRARKD